MGRWLLLPRYVLRTDPRKIHTGFLCPCSAYSVLRTEYIFMILSAWYYYYGFLANSGDFVSDLRHVDHWKRKTEHISCFLSAHVSNDDNARLHTNQDILFTIS
jgi:hypothetical protein